MPQLSFIIPVHNEAKNVAPLHARILDMCAREGHKDFEILFVDDGSTDGTYAALTALEPVTIIRLRKQYGQTGALHTGLQQAKGDILITLDGDLQNDPDDVPLLLGKLEEGYDVVSGWRWERKDSFWKCFVSRGAHFLRTLFINDGIHDSGCTLKAYRRECFDNLNLFSDTHRFIPAILRWRGFSVTEVKVSHHPRTNGKTKYGLSRVLPGFLDMINVWFWRKFMHRPLHLFGGVGLFLMLASFIMATVAAVQKLRLGVDVSDNALTMLSAVGVLAGLQLFVIGILSDIMIRMYFQTMGEDPYIVRDIFETKATKINASVRKHAKVTPATAPRTRGVKAPMKEEKM